MDKEEPPKDKIMCNIPVLPVAASILDKYKDVSDYTGKLLPVLCNQRMNSYLKEIADVCGIHKTLAHIPPDIAMPQAFALQMA